MIRHGQAPYLECSTRGERRLSAFVARPTSLGGLSIEVAYQAMKLFADGTTGLTWRQAKGRRAENAAECAQAYDEWWREYIAENPDLEQMLMDATGLSDMFGRPGSVCQATVLWTIRRELIDMRDRVTYLGSGDHR